jgi:hypothetical protein
VQQFLQRIVYDASVDDAVDCAWRLSNRSPAFRKQIRLNVIIASIASAVVVFVFFAFFEANRTGPMLLVILAMSAVCGLICAGLFRRQFIKDIFKQQRKIVVDQFGGKTAIPSELELRQDAVWVRQAGMEMLFPWNVCTSVVDNPDDIELNFTPGICVVRSRHFASPTERQAFLETARRLSAKRGQ